MRLAERTLRLLAALPFALVAALVFSSCGETVAGPRSAQTDSSAFRVVVLGGAAGELVAALGFADRVVGADSSAVAAADLGEGAAHLGYVRSVPVEGLVSLVPDLVLATAEVGPPEALAQLASLRVPLVLLPAGHGAEAVRARILAAGHALGAKEEARALADAMDLELVALAERASSAPRRVRALWLLQPGGGAPMVGGGGTAAAALLDLAGAEHAAAQLQGWQSLSLEALLEMEPDVVFVASPRVEPGPLGPDRMAQLWPTLVAADRTLAPRFVALEPGAHGGGPSLPRHLAAVLDGLEGAWGAVGSSPR